MRGIFDATKVKTRADYEALSEEEKQKFRNFLKGTIVKQRDIQNYPSDYDWDLKEGDTGYLEPLLEEYEDLSVVERFGFSKLEL